jgi:D-alanine-D-alanine ligase
MKICVLQPSYHGSSCDYRHYDPRRNLSRLLPDHEFHHAFLNKASTFRQIRELRKQHFDVYVNLCEGYLDSDVPSLDVILALEHFDLPYTGPTPDLYDPPKHLMKLVAESEGVATPAYWLVETDQDIAAACSVLQFPLFVKPDCAGDSIGIDQDSLVQNVHELKHKAGALIEEYGAALIEEFVEGREFTVLVCADSNPAQRPLALRPLEFVFPPGERFKTYEMKVKQYHPECNIPCAESELAERLREAARRVFRGFSGEGYARMDFRLSKGNTLHFLEVNFACSVFYPEGYQGSADYILQHDGLGQAGFLSRIIEEALARHAGRQKPYGVRRGKNGYGTFASRKIARGEIVFAGEERPQRLATWRHVERAWDAAAREVFRRFAYPVGDSAYILWNKNPAHWAPQNHSCDPNTAFAGLDVVALRDISPDEEITIDYGTFYDDLMPEFECKCGSANCRKRISGRSRACKTEPPAGADPRLH